MVACRAMRLSAAALLMLPGCRGLDVVPVLEGDHCALPREEVVACTLDGDTFNVATCGGESVRMLGVDAPEIAHDDAEVPDCWGPESQAYLNARLEGQTVRLEFDSVCTDAYDRTLAYAWLPDGDPEDEADDILINEEIIRLGYAVFYEDFGDIRLAQLLTNAEWSAESADAGIWGACE